MATVTHLSYPGGPPGLAVRLDRHDLKALFWAVAKRAWPAIPLLVVLVVAFAHLNTRPNVYGLLEALCLCLIGLIAFAPGVVVGNFWMSTYYFDERWIAWYLGPRRRSVDMTMISRVTSRWRNLDGCWAFRSSKSSLVIRLRVPEVILVIDEVRALVASGLAVAERTHEVKLDERTRQTLGQPPHARSADGSIYESIRELGRPPLRSWPGMPRGVNLRLRQQEE